MNKKTKKLTKVLIKQLLEHCLRFSNVSELNSSDSLNYYQQLNLIVEKIIHLEKGKQANLPKFLEWCQLNNLGLDDKKLHIRYINDEIGFGVIAKCDIEKESLLFKIPQNLMLSCETQDKLLRQFIKEDDLLSKMPNLALAFQVMNEYCKNDSFWQAYLKIFPTTYSTVIYFTKEEMTSLEGSPTLFEAINLCITFYRQYAYFWTKLKSKNGNLWSDLPFFKHFSFEFYRWAVSSVMTRQNQIPFMTKTNSIINVLIPLWDFCNHQEGQFSTDFNVESKFALCFAMKKFKKNEQVTIFYGNRSNGSFFIHNGFVDPLLSKDYLKIKLGMGKNDTLVNQKITLCSKLSLSISGFFPLFNKHAPIDEKLLAFLRIFSMSKDELNFWLNADVNVKEFFNANASCFNLIDAKVDKFLTNRAKLLLDNYRNKLVVSDQSKLTISQKLINKLIECEQKILKSYLE